jgi:VWFA-related protein
VAGAKLTALQAGVRDLLRGLSPADEAALVTFDHEVRMLVPRTPDVSLVLRAVDGIRPRGATALFDALYAGTLVASGGGRSLLVLFTDGEHNMSWLDAARVRRVLEESNVLVQAVGTVPAPPAQTLTDGRGSEAPEPQHARTLRQLAETTGGRFWPAASYERLAAAFREMLQAMKTRYVLRFEAPRGRRAGRHELEVSLVRRKGRVHCRRRTSSVPRPAGAAGPSPPATAVRRRSGSPTRGLARIGGATRATRCAGRPRDPREPRGAPGRRSPRPRARRAERRRLRA